MLLLAGCGSANAVAQEQSGNSEADGSNTEQAETVALTAEMLAQYAGRYGARQIAVAGLSLTFQRDGMPTAVSLKSLGDDKFQIIIPAGAVVRGPAANGPPPIILFDRAENGRVVSLSLVNGDGEVMSTSERDTGNSAN